MIPPQQLLVSGQRRGACHYADRDRAPWIIWQSLDAAYTSNFNVGIWRDADAFQKPIGQFIDNSRAPVAFEAEPRQSVLDRVEVR
jgi:hypothetical protein